MDIVEAVANGAFAKLCENCGLCNRSSVTALKQVTGHATGESPTIMFVKTGISEADQAARGLWSDSAMMHKLVKTLMEVLNLPTYEDAYRMCYWTSVLKCPHPSYTDGRTEKALTPIAHVKHCADILRNEIINVKPRVIIGIGGHSDTNVVSVLGLSDAARGVVSPLPSTLTFHTKGVTAQADFPCSVMRIDNPWNADSFQPWLWETIRHDLAKISKIFAGTYPSQDLFAGRNYFWTCNDADWAIGVFDYFAGLEEFALDIECGPAGVALDPWSENSRILGIGMADRWRRSYFIGLNHKDAQYGDRYPEVIAAMRRCLTSKARKTCQNGAGYDLLWFPLKYGFMVENYSFDTQLAHGLLNENLPHSLKFLAEMYTDLEYYDDELQSCFVDAKGNPLPAAKRCYESHVTFDQLARYCCADADATQQLKMLFDEQLTAQGLSQLFYEQSMPDARSVILTELEGIALNHEHHQEMSVEFNTKLLEVEARLRSNPLVEKFMIDNSRDEKGAGKYLITPDYRVYRDIPHLRTAPASYLGRFNPDTKVFVEGSGLDELVQQRVVRYRKRDRVYILTMSKTYTESDVTLNVNSKNQLPTFLFGRGYCNFTPVKQSEKTGDHSTDKEVLEALAAQGHQIANDIIAYRVWSRNVGSYAAPFVKGRYDYTDDSGRQRSGQGYLRDDGLMHPIYIMTGNDRGMAEAGKKDKEGTVTGRKSAKEPPIQTMKTRGPGAKQVKKLFTTKHPGGGLASSDFSQLEIRLFGLLAGIRWMIERYQQGADLHADIGMEAFNMTREQVMANDGEYRGHAKSIWFGPLYGEEAGGLAADLTRKGFPTTKEQAREMLDRTYAKMPEYLAYKSKIEESLRQYGAVWTVLGRRRLLPMYFSDLKWISARAVRQGVNVTIQSPGSEMTTWCWHAFHSWAERMGLRTRIAITVHDSLIRDVPPKELAITSVAMAHMMGNVPFRFLQNSPVPIIADHEAGRAWGEQQRLNKPINTPEGKSRDEFMQTLHSDLWPYVDSGVAPLEHWNSELFNHSWMDPVREACSRIVM